VAGLEDRGSRPTSRKGPPNVRRAAAYWTLNNAMTGEPLVSCSPRQNPADHYGTQACGRRQVC
jgi:hypothetical protein